VQLAVLVDQRVAGDARVLSLYAKQAANRVRQKTGNHRVIASVDSPAKKRES